MNVAQLKALCKDQGLKVSGKKAVLQERLREHFLKEAQPATTVDEFDDMSDEDLRTSLGARELDTSGDRQEMLDRLREDIEFTQQIASATTGDSATGYKTISEALAAAAESHDGGTITEILADIKSKTEQVPKWVDVTIRSLGMQPEKYTAGGAPSVTADVLRKLAGDPFADPPKHGAVSMIVNYEAAVVLNKLGPLTSHLFSLQAFDFFGGGQEGREACIALDSLCQIGSIDTMIANFLTSLQSLADHQSRVHCSLNLVSKCH